MKAVNIRPASASDAPVIAKMLAHLADDLGDGDVSPLRNHCAACR